MNPFVPLAIILGLFGLVVAIQLLRSIRIVPAQSSYIVERLGRYASSLGAGFHVLVPFLDRVAYKHTLKEQAIDVPSQECFTMDNVKVSIDGVLYLKVVDPKRASYGVTDYRFACVCLAQTTIRAVVGKLELDRTFEERGSINAAVVRAVDEAASPWGVKVTRYEIQNIKVPDSVLKSMELQMKAERDKRAEIAKSLGVMESKINYSKASMEEAVNKSEGEKQRAINEAEGRAAEILAVAKATADSIRTLAAAVSAPQGREAASLRLAEAYIESLRKLAAPGNTVILPIDLADPAAVTRRTDRLLGG
ncbi:MAG TPA: stomatin-like protein [Spirochaetales bacterium]|nr:stomatin-like protein [Spirochaetales bacterium]HRZ64643.1 stomatin-like protein [Spirochaetia bacterium]